MEFQRILDSINVEAFLKRKIVKGYVICDKGLLRNNNEDNYLLGHCINANSDLISYSHFAGNVGEWTCAGVFDGMGGLENGEVASLLVAETIQDETMFISEMDDDKLVETVRLAFMRANEKMMLSSLLGESGSTASVVVFNGDKLKVFHIGDSRVYIKRKGGLYKLSKDQTLAQMKMDIGIYHNIDEIPEREKHQLMEYIGMNNFERPYETDWVKFVLDDVLLICSDGLYDMCSEQRLLSTLLEEKDIERCAKELRNIAYGNGGKDNITILMMKVEE